jgi:hypothetical protein
MINLSLEDKVELNKIFSIVNKSLTIETSLNDYYKFITLLKN